MSVIGKKTQSRGTWTIKPVTRIKESKKAYNRKENKRDTRKRVDDRD
jgi:hypothetical protein